MRTLSFTISLVLCFLFIEEGIAQKEEIQKKDSIIYKTSYGLRLGIDISKPALALFDKDYSALEIVGDYRITRSHYITSELGYEKKNTIEDYTSSSASGSYIKLGGNYNAYTNWLDMNNEIYVGARYGFALFNQKLISYKPNVTENYFPTTTTKPSIKPSDLTAHWVEVQLGVKVETLKNLFVGFHVAYKIGISIQDPENFKTLYAPGFNRVFASNTGFGFNYTISYLIPFVRK